MKIISEETGEEIEVLTPEEAKAAQDAAVAAESARLKAEHDAAIAAEKAHTQEKLDQFKRAQGGAEAEKEAAKAAIELAQKTADEAKTAIAAAEAEKIATKKDYWIKSVIGSDPELTKKINDNLAIINLPETTDAEIQAKVQMAINMSGIGSVQNHGGMSFSGAVPPVLVTNNDQSVKEHNYEVWKNELGIADFIPKPSTNK